MPPPRTLNPLPAGTPYGPGKPPVTAPDTADWFAQQGAPGGGAPAPSAPPGGTQYDIDPTTGYYYPGNRIAADGSAWLIGIDQAHSRQVAPPGSFDPTSGTGITNPARPTGQAPSGAPAPAGTPPGGGPAPGEDPQAFIQRTLATVPYGPEGLGSLTDYFKQHGFTVNTSTDGGVRGRITNDRTGEFYDVTGPGESSDWWNNRRGTTWGWTPHAADTGGGGAPGGIGAIGAGLENTPGYQFRLQQGLQALERSAAARGTLLTGGTLKGIQKYAQDVASTEYGNRVNQLMDLSKLGFGAATTTANLGSNYAGQQSNILDRQATNLTDLTTGRGNVNAAQTVAQGQAFNPAINSASNLAQLYYLQQLMNRGGT